MGQLVKIVFRLVAASDGRPITGDDLLVWIYDRDPFQDDLLGECGVDANGFGELMFDLGKVSSLDSPGETDPDVYLEVLRAGTPVFRSQVKRDVDFLSRHPVTGMAGSLTKDLGVFEVGLGSTHEWSNQTSFPRRARTQRQSRVIRALR